MTGDIIVLVLWMDQFDELAATAFITSLRKLGVRVKLVGAAHHRLMGASGLALVPDVTLEQALPVAHSATAVVVPGSVGFVRRLGNDPRMRDLLVRARSNQATLITSEGAVSELAALMDCEYVSSIFKSYPDDPVDIGRINHLVEELTTTTGSTGRSLRQ